MTPKSIQRCKALLKVQEDYQRFPYRDTKGHLTIGYGLNLETVGMSETVASFCLDEEMRFHIDACKENISFFDQLDSIRQIVLVIMSYNLGHKNFIKFEKMLAAINLKDFNEAANEMENSLWYTQIGHRGDVLVNMMRTGQL